MSSKVKEASQWQTIQEEEMCNFIMRSLASVGTKTQHAEVVARVLLSADKRGIYSHGLNKLDDLIFADMYVKDIEHKTTSVDKEPVIINETVSTAWVDGNDCLGAVVGCYCMDLAIKKAKDTGVGWVVAKGSTHFGIAGYYSMTAAEQQCLGMCFTNTSPFMVPTRSRERGLGTNPISCAANGSNGDSFVLDMATTPVAHSKIELARRRGASIPDGWACDGTGKQTNDPVLCMTEGGGFPLGGEEENGGYKGYGLAMMVEILCAIMGGANFGQNVRPYKTRDKLHNIGQCFIAVDPDCFAPGFDGRLTEILQQMRTLETAEGETEVLVAGDPEKTHMEYCQKRGGIPYHPSQIEYAMNIAKELGVDPPKVEK